MIPFFVVFLRDNLTNEQIDFSKSDGSDTPVVILDDGWSPAITTYVRDGEKTWSDVVEEIECMTNVATRDEALALLENLNALIHRAARDIEEKQIYTVSFSVLSQFSTAPNNAFTFVLSPPDDSNVVKLSTDIQTAPPGQIRFKLRFRRTGAWITTFADTSNQFNALANGYGYRGIWYGPTTLSTPINIPTPISLQLTPVLSNNGVCTVEKLFLCTNIQQIFVIKYFIVPSGFNSTQITYPGYMHALYNVGYSIQSNANYSDPTPGPYSVVYMPKGVYAIFVSWRSVQPNIPHALKLRFSGNEETNHTLLLAKNTYPKLAYLGTVTIRSNTTALYLLPKIGHSTGFELEKIVLIQLKNTSSVLQLAGLTTTFQLASTEALFVENNALNPYKKAGIIDANNPYAIKTMLQTYDSLDIVADSQNFSLVAVGHSPEIFSLHAYDGSTYAHVNYFSATLTYRSVRTTIQ